MKVAVIGSRGIDNVNIGEYIPKETAEIVSGGAKGVDTSAREYALSHGLKLTEFLPEYDKFGRSAPLKRNIQIIEYADLVIAFWDGGSHGTKFVIDHCKQLGKPCEVHIINYINGRVLCNTQNPIFITNNACYSVPKELICDHRKKKGGHFNDNQF